MLEAFYVLTVSFIPFTGKGGKRPGSKEVVPNSACFMNPETVTIPLNMRVIKQKVNALPVSTGQPLLKSPH